MIFYILQQGNNSSLSAGEVLVPVCVKELINMLFVCRFEFDQKRMNTGHINVLLCLRHARGQLFPAVGRGTFGEI